MNVQFPTGVGAILAVIVLIAALVLGIMGQLSLWVAVLIGLLAVARLL
jgi:hypothetical protein